jgi:DNA topoisomerase-1
MGRYGPFVQIGTKDDVEKPRFAGLRSDQRMDTITLEEALELFKLPRQLGATPEGEPLEVNIGRFGPYVRYGGKYVSLKGGDDPYTLSLERALELVAEHKTMNAGKVIQAFADAAVQVLRGRFGPYITDGKRNARVPKGREPESLTLAECTQLLQQAPAKKTRRRAVRKTA